MKHFTKLNKKKICNAVFEIFFKTQTNKRTWLKHNLLGLLELIKRKINLELSYAGEALVEQSLWDDISSDQMKTDGYSPLPLEHFAPLTLLHSLTLFASCSEGSLTLIHTYRGFQNHRREEQMLKAVLVLWVRCLHMMARVAGVKWWLLCGASLQHPIILHLTMQES